MEFKKHIIISHEVIRKWASPEKLQLKVKTGISADDLAESLDKGWVPDKSDRLYFFSGCTVPRFKVREKWNVTIKPDNGTAAFISPKTMQSSDTMFDVWPSLELVDGEEFGKWLTHVYGPKHYFVIKYKSILLNCEDQVFIHEHTMGRMRHSAPEDALQHPEDGTYDWECMHNVSMLNSDCVTFYTAVPNSQIDKLTCNIYNQDEILKVLNEDNLIIDEKKYQELRLMAKSSDSENIILVMELMANADVKKSFVYLLLLLQEFKLEITSHRKEVNHVNFKGLLTLLGLDSKKLNNGYTVEMFVEGMKKNKQFTRSNVQRVTQFFADESDHIINTEHFVKGPVLRQEFEEDLDDFGVSEESEIQIEDEDNNV